MLKLSAHFQHVSQYVVMEDGMLSITVKLPNGSKKPLNVNRSETVRKVVEMCMGDQATKWILKGPRPWRQPGKTKTLEAAGVPNGAMCSLKAMPKGKNTRAKEKRNCCCRFWC